MVTTMMCPVVIILMRVQFKHRFDPIRQTCDGEGAGDAQLQLQVGKSIKFLGGLVS